MQLDTKPVLRVVACFVLSSAIGCGEGKGRNLPKAPISGAVSYAKPFPQGEVIFKHQSGEITVAKFGADGTYQAQVPEGHNIVMVRAQTSSRNGTRKPGPEMEVFKNHIPARYGDFATSKLEYTVAPGNNQFNIALVD